MDFFSKCKDQDEAKALFRKLSKNFHPDAGGDSDLMIELKKQYDEWEKPKEKYFDFGKMARLNEEETVNYSWNTSSFMNPRVEALENELRRLRALLGDAPSKIESLRNYNRLKEEENTQYKIMLREAELKMKDFSKQFDGLKDSYEKLLKEKADLEKVTITKEETADTLWGKIKFVMGCNPKKVYK
jgi:curved DNA-binding protein CbpA